MNIKEIKMVTWIIIQIILINYRTCYLVSIMSQF